MANKVFYNKEYNLEFYTIPKCGSTSIREALNLTHHDVNNIPDDRRVFAVIRDPLDRFLSSFLYCRKLYGSSTSRGGEGSKRRTLSKTFHHKDLKKSLELFLVEIETHGFFDGHNNPQSIFLDGLVTRSSKIPREFNKITDFILFEEMSTRIPEISSDAVKMKKLNPSSGKDKASLKPVIEKYRDRIIAVYQDDWDLYQKLKNA